MLQALSNTSVDLLQNDFWVLEVESTNNDGSLVDSAPAFVVTSPDGTPVVAVPEHLSLGRYRVVVALTQPSRWVAVATNAYGATSFAAYVQAISGDMPTVDDVIAYAGEHIGSWADPSNEEVVQQALDSEASAQRRKCNVGAVYPPDLAEALMRRVMVNLAMRAVTLPTEMMGDAQASVAPLYRDPVISRLEAPYRRVFFR